MLKDHILDLLDSGVDILVDKEIDPSCEGITRNSLRFWDVLKECIFIDDIISAEMLYDEHDWYRLLLTDRYNRQFYFYGVSSGYGGEGPRGTEKILKDCGFRQSDIVFSETEFIIYK